MIYNIYYITVFCLSYLFNYFSSSFFSFSSYHRCTTSRTSKTYTILTLKG